MPWNRGWKSTARDAGSTRPRGTSEGPLCLSVVGNLNLIRSLDKVILLFQIKGRTSSSREYTPYLRGYPRVTHSNSVSLWNFVKYFETLLPACVMGVARGAGGKTAPE